MCFRLLWLITYGGERIVGYQQDKIDKIDIGFQSVEIILRDQCGGIAGSYSEAVNDIVHYFLNEDLLPVELEFGSFPH